MVEKLAGVYDDTWFVDFNTPVIILATRNEQGVKELKEIRNFCPYVYTTRECYEKHKEKLQSIVAGVEATSKKLLNGSNKELIKIILPNFFKQREIGSILEEVYEGDIGYVQRYILDNIDELTSVKFRLNYFDIETTSEKGFPNYKNPVEKVISISSYDNYLNKQITWIWHKKYKEEIIQRETKDGPLEIRRFEDEEKMLNDFINFINITQPDYMLAWNVNFDMRYFVARAERLHLPVDRLSPFYGKPYSKRLTLVKWFNGPGVYGKLFADSFEEEKNVQISGLQYFDLLSGYKKINAKEQESWKLDYIAQVELGENKLETNFDIGKRWEVDPEFIEEYNYIDTLLIKKLNDKLNILDYFLTIKNSSFLIKANDVFSSGKVLDNYILKKNKDKWIFPTKPGYNDKEDRKKVGGGFVRENIPGVYKNVACFDFSGFYPSLIKTFNLSGDVIRKGYVEHLDTDIEEEQNIDFFKEECVSSYDRETQQVTYNINTNKFRAKLVYDISRKGVMAEAVEDLTKLRNEAKKERDKHKYGSLEYLQKDKNQFSYKFIINAAYGTSAYPGFRLYSNENANAITGFARMLSKWVSYNLDLKGWKTLAGDTDSLFIQLFKSENLEDNLKECDEAFEVIKKAIEDFVAKFLPEGRREHSLLMEMEKIYKNVLLLDVKKRYIGYLKYYNGKEVDKIHYMGLDLKKSNTIQICKTAQMELAKAVLKGEGIDEVFQEFYATIKTSKDVNLFKIPSKLEKHQADYKSNTPPVRASLWSNDNLKTKFRGGTKFYIIYVEESKELQTDVIAFETNKQLESLNYKLDRIKYIKDLYSKFTNLIRGLPEIQKRNETYYQRTINQNKSLGEYF